MTSKPKFSIDVDLSSPGQFFACCGLLELANCLDEGAEGYFDGQQFHFNAAVEDFFALFRKIDFVQQHLSEAQLKARNGKVPKDASTIEPITLSIGGQEFVLDWWLRPRKHDGLKLWSGSNNIRAFFEDVTNFVGNDDLLFALTQSGQLKREPFYYAATRPLNEVHFGVSMDKIGRKFQHLPYIELLTIIALQRFQPQRLSGNQFGYATWSKELPANIAAAVVAGLLPNLQTESFSFPVIDRDDNGHKQFTRSERRSHV